MDKLDIAAAGPHRYDCMALGEVMLRLDPGEQRSRRSRQFQAWEGGGEYNVVQGLSSCFNQRSAIITALVDNDIGQLIASLIRSSGVDDRYIQWCDFDGVGQQSRNGLYFMERGFGERGAKATMDRGHTAIAAMQPQDIDWEALFQQAQPRWFHVGGVMAGLAPQSPQVVVAAMRAAKAAGAVVSYDLNYRDSLWRNRGGRAAAQDCNAQLIQLADVLFGIEQLPRAVSGLEQAVFAEALLKTQLTFPHLKAIVTTMRVVRDASHNDWGGLALVEGELVEARQHPGLPIFDRVGGGDAFAAGFIYGLLNGESAASALNLAVAHGALVMSTPGDNSQSSEAEVRAFAAGGSAAAAR